MLKALKSERYQAGGYYWANPRINDRNFPVEPRVSSATLQCRIILLVGFDRTLTGSDEAEATLQHNWLRSATLQEILAFGERYPTKQLEGPIVGLGSEWVTERKNRMIPVLLRGKGKRRLGLYIRGGEYSIAHLFAAATE